MRKNNLQVEFCGRTLENPFVLASAPPASSASTIFRGFEAGWAGAVTKSISLYPVSDKTPRIGYLRKNNRIFASQNYEMGSELRLELWESELEILKNDFPDKLLIASIFAGSDIKDWERLAESLCGTSIDGFELNFSCPHSDSQGMGYLIGQNKELCGDITQAVYEKSKGKNMIIMPKLPYLSYPNSGSIARLCEQRGANAIAAINTIAGLSAINPKTLEPYLNTNGKTSPGGIGGSAICNFAYLIVNELAKSVSIPVSAMGGVSDLESMVSFFAYGANHLQVCTEVMEKGYSSIDRMLNHLEAFLNEKKMTLSQLRGIGLEKTKNWNELDSSKRKVIQTDNDCSYCGKCSSACVFSVITVSKPQEYIYISSDRCSGCGSCASACPTGHLKI